MSKHIVMAAAMLALLPPSLALARENKAVAAMSDQQKIIAWAADWKRFVESGEIEQLRAMYEPDAVLMTNGAPPQKGIEKILAFLAGNKAAGNEVRVDFANEQLVVEEDRAYLTAKYWMTITPPAAAPVEVSGRSFLVFKKGGDGEWRLWRDIDNQAPDILAEERPGG